MAGTTRTSRTPTSFTLQWTDGPTYFADILMVAQKGKFGASYWNEGYKDKDLRCSFDLGGLWPEKTLPAGTQRVNFLMRFADDINSAAAAALHAEDYRAPDRLTILRGSVVTTDEGDRDADGYNEEEGCYVLKGGVDGVAFTIHGKATPRVNPVFKIKGWPGEATTRNMTGTKLRSSVASVREGALILQLLGVVDEDVALKIEPEGK